MLQGGTPIPENANLDDYKTPGSYYCASYVIADTIENNPFPNVPFILKVEYGQGTAYPTQTFQNMFETKIARRMYNPDAGSGNWQPYVYFSDDETILEQSCKYIRYLNSGTQQTVDFNNLRENYPLIVSAMDDAYKYITFLNTPTDISVGGFVLMSLPIGTAYALQIFYPYGSNYIYYRASRYSDGVFEWLPWRSFAGDIVS